MSGIANEQNLKRGNPETQFNSRSAVEAKKKSDETKKRNKGVREAMQNLLNGTYNLKDKSTGEVKTMSGKDAIALSIMQTAMNPKDKNWKSAVQFALQLIGEDKSKDENKLIKAQAKMLKAKADLLTGADTTTLDKLDSILNGMKELAEADAPIGDSNDKAESETE